MQFHKYVQIAYGAIAIVQYPSILQLGTSRHFFPKISDNI